MLNGVNINYIVVLLVSGAVLLAAIYHTILYTHRRTKLLGRYSVYLWSTFAYCLFRTVVFFHNEDVYRYLNPDEILQMVSFVMYVRFASNALSIDQLKDKYAFLFVELTPYVIAFYLLLNTVLINSSADLTSMYIALKIIARCYLLLIGLLVILVVIRKRQSPFYRYLAAGAICMIVFGIASSVISMVPPETFILGAISWLMFGFFSDVVFFSAAIGYRTRQEHNEREMSLKQLLNKEAELQQMELEKIKAIYETREEERLRIARDLHDDMGSTLSSISIYSKVVESYIDTDKTKAHEYLDKIQENAKMLMENTSDLIWSLQTNYGEVESLFKRMHQFAIETLSSSSITPHVNISAEEDLPVLNIAAQKNCWLIFKEALNNVCKYSNATTCFISIQKDNDNLVMCVSDNGIGFQNPTSGNGLGNMRLRATELHGVFTIKTIPGEGTIATAIFPVNRISVSTP